MEKGYFDIAKAAKFDNEGRLSELRPYELLKEQGSISRNMTCVDLGCGTGTFTIPVSYFVGLKGTIYAVDSSEAMIEHIRTRTSAPNIVTVLSDVANTGLASEIADLCLMAFILHEVSYPEQVITEAARLLKPGGIALVVEWRAELVSKGPPKSVRLNQQRIEALYQQAGLIPLSYVNWSINHCVARAKK